MLNQFIVVGRVEGNIKNGHITGEDCKQIKVSCPRSYKNEEGIYETDSIPVLLFGVMAEKSLEHIKPKDVIGVKGSICSFDGKLYLRAGKITLLSSNTSISEENEEEE